MLETQQAPGDDPKTVIYLDEVVDLVFKNWKSTATGVLTAASLCITAVQLLPPGSSKAVISLSVIGALISCLKKDAGKQSVLIPGDNKVQVVDSHEEPNDPNAKAV